MVVESQYLSSLPRDYSGSSFARMQTLATRLAWARERRGWTQNELSDASGVKQGTISKIERGDQHRTSFVTDLAEALGVSARWLADGTGTAYTVKDAEPSYEINASPRPRRIMVIDDIQAGAWRDCIDTYEAGDGFDELTLDPDAAVRYSDCAFGLRVTGNSMTPLLDPGDRVVVDPGEPVRPGDIVVAKLENEQQATIKKYRSRGTDENGVAIFELVPLNDDFPVLRVDANNPGHIIGPIVEYRRSFR